MVLVLQSCSQESQQNPITVDSGPTVEPSIPTKPPELTKPTLEGASSLDTAPLFKDVHDELSVNFIYDTGANGRSLMVEATGGGAGWLDVDRDGRWDLYLVQGGNPTAEIVHETGDLVLRNLGPAGFTDITGESRRIDNRYGQGIAIGDFDNDGFDDVYVTNVGENQLLRNLGDGTFEDVTELAGVGDARWSTSAAWADLDNDGDLDLYVCNYVDYNVFDPKRCVDDDGQPATCHPLEVDGIDNGVFENTGNGQFRSVYEEWGFKVTDSKSLGVVAADFNHDGMTDLFVANDVTPNHMFRQVATGEFQEQGVTLGCAMNQFGQFQASMGVAFGDYDRNGYSDLYVTHFTEDSNTLYANFGEVGFRDLTRVQRLHKPVLESLGFGTVMEDFNYDGHMDLFIANGHIDDWRDKGDDWKMHPQFFSHTETGWVEQSSNGGSYFTNKFLGRAVAKADYDNDGDCDLLVIHQNESNGLLQNAQVDGNWLKLNFVGHESNRRGIGVRVEVSYGDEQLVQQLAGGTSFCSGHEPALFFGLGDWSGNCEITVAWPMPNSVTTVLKDVSLNQSLVIHESTN